MWKKMRRLHVQKYVFLFAILVLIGFSLYFYSTADSFQNSLIEEKYFDRKLDVNIMCDILDGLVKQNGDWGSYDYTTILRNIVQELDENSRTSTQLLDENLSVIAIRTPIFSHSPIVVEEYPELVEAIRTQDSGELTIRFDKPDIPTHDVSVYFRWVPSDPSAEHKLLVMIGVSRFTIDQKTVRWVQIGDAALIIFAALFVLWKFICELGGGEDDWKRKTSSC